jgi:hypothetical protein
MGQPAVLATAPRVAAATVILGISLASAMVAASGGDVGRLVHAAPPNADPAAVPAGLTLRETDEGFDGMFYYRVAASPLASADQVNGVRLDLPALRSSRVLYPALAAVAGLGDDSRLPWTLLGVNLVALGAVGYFGARLAEDLGRPPLCGMLLAAYPGFVYTLGHDLTELTDAALVLAGLHLLHHRRYLPAGLALAGAALAKETGLIVPIGVTLAWLWEQLPTARRPSDHREHRDRPSLSAALPAALPIVVFACWHLVVRSRFGASPLGDASNNNLRPPLAGLASVAGRFEPTSAANVFRDLSLAALVLVAGAAALAWRHTRADLGVRLAWAISAVLLLVLSEHVYAGATSFMRAGTESYLLGLAVLLGTRRVSLTLMAAPVSTLTVLTVVTELVKAA